MNSPGNLSLQFYITTFQNNIFSVNNFFLSFSTLNISSYSLFSSKISAETYTNSLIIVSLYIAHHLSLAAFKILSLSLASDSSVIMDITVCLLGSILFCVLDGLHGSEYMYIFPTFLFFPFFSLIL